MTKFILLDTFLIDEFYVTQNYFANKTYYSQFNLLGHEGVDFGHKNKSIIIRTPISGTCFVGYDKAYGNYCVIEDYKQKCAVYLCHMNLPLVVSGQEVKAGDQIGEMDDTGNSSGEHLHLNFLILNDSGSNKYKSKEFNFGYLDPQYPRDTGTQVKFNGVEDYQIEWVKEIQVKEPMSDLQSVLDYYKVKTKDELIKMIDEQLKFLKDERVKNTNLLNDLEKINLELSEYKKSSEKELKKLNKQVEELLISKNQIDIDLKGLMETLKLQGFSVSRGGENQLIVSKVFTFQEALFELIESIKRFKR